jgi:hypothetical protein
LIRDHPRKSAVQGFANCQLLLFPRINTDFSSHFHIYENCENRIAPAWILGFSNRLHRFLLGHLWTLCKLLILRGL